jgi:carboxylesterase type B
LITDFIYGNPTSFPFDGWVKQSPNVVVVSVYYRLSSFGFLSHPSLSRKDLNAGFQDQVEALRWVQKYISAFGGDPTKVTIDGHSAGGASVELHLVTQSGLQEKLFRAAIAQSVSRRPLPLPEQQAVC